MGGYFFVLGPLLSFTIILNEIVREKELKLRQGLQVVGVSHTVYWLSWVSVAVFFSLVSTIILLITSLICQFDMFTNSPLVMMFLIFFTFSMAMNMLAFFVSTLVPT
jgi:ABC-type multidrug transport system permease subunit